MGKQADSEADEARLLSAYAKAKEREEASQYWSGHYGEFVPADRKVLQERKRYLYEARRHAKAADAYVEELRQLGASRGVDPEVLERRLEFERLKVEYSAASRDVYAPLEGDPDPPTRIQKKTQQWLEERMEVVCTAAGYDLRKVDDFLKELEREATRYSPG